MFFTRDKSFYTSLVRLAIPIALQNAITFAVGLADNLMIGTLGDSAISGVYVGNQMQTLLQMFIGGIEGAILILAAQYWGKRDTSSIRKIVAIGIRFALAIGVLLSLVAVLFPSQILSIFTPDADVIAEGTLYQQMQAELTQRGTVYPPQRGLAQHLFLLHLPSIAIVEPDTLCFHTRSL